MSSVNEVLLEQSDQFSRKTSVVHKNQETFKVYKIRWFMLFILTTCYACLTFHTLQFSIIANIVVEFYGVSYEAVNWTTMVVFVLYLPAFVPAMSIINKIGLRASVLTAMVGISVGSWIKVGSAAPDKFWVALTGQVLVALVQPFIIVLPAQFASAWFGMEQTGLACCIAILGSQIGFVLGTYLPTALIHYSKDKDAVAHEMWVYNIGTAVVCSTVFILAFIFFKSEPPTPPSEIRKQLKTDGSLNFKESTILLFRNPSYVIFLLACALSSGAFFGLSALLNQILLQYYPDATEDVGKISMIACIGGVFSITGSGFVLGRPQRYRLITISVFSLCLLGSIMFTLAPLHSLTAVYVGDTVLRFFLVAANAINLEIAAHLTYPVPESISSCYLLAAAVLDGIIFTYLYSFLLYNYSVLLSNIVTCGLLLISTILIVSMKFKCQRPTVGELHNERLKTVDN